MESITTDFIIIDDDNINNMICEKVIQMTCPKANVRSFLDPIEGLDLILSRYLSAEHKLLTLFLDINMPLMNGWEVLDNINEFSEYAGKRLKIYILSSSISDEDKERAYNHPLITDFICKPLTQKVLREILLPELVALHTITD